MFFNLVIIQMGLLNESHTAATANIGLNRPLQIVATHVASKHILCSETGIALDNMKFFCYNI